MGDETDVVLARAWERQKQWSLVADQCKRKVTSGRIVVLTLLASGALLQPLAKELGKLIEGHSLVPMFTSGLGAAALACVPILRRAWLGTQNVGDWARARSASEALKHEIYLYLTRTEPYHDSTAGNLLAERRADLLHKIEDLEKYAATVEVKNADPPKPMDAAAYFEQRVASQIAEYYRPQAKKLARRCAAYRSLELWLSILAAILGALASAWQASSVGAWVAVVTTVGAAITAHIAANGFDQKIRAYLSTAQRLEDLRDSWMAAVSNSQITPEKTSALIRDCERIISIENEGWMSEAVRKEA
jgi:hypothetical protein